MQYKALKGVNIIGNALQAESKHPEATKHVKEVLSKNFNKISRTDRIFQRLREAAKYDPDVYDWLKLRNLEPGNEANTQP